MSEEKHDLLFIRSDEDGETRDYICVDDDPAWRAKVKFVIEHGVDYVDLLGPLLVRHGDGARRGHYPVPFLFRSEAERATNAEKRQIQPPRRTWVQWKLRLLYEYAGCDYQQAA